ncbi:hypothetical protein KR054_002771 [Drosophila jambulina]|nr:hypothetical protein KR054_002771 [Drosophila jambulina]
MYVILQPIKAHMVYFLATTEDGSLKQVLYTKLVSAHIRSMKTHVLQKHHYRSTNNLTRRKSSMTSYLSLRRCGRYKWSTTCSRSWRTRAQITCFLRRRRTPSSWTSDTLRSGWTLAWVGMNALNVPKRMTTSFIDLLESIVVSVRTAKEADEAAVTATKAYCQLLTTITAVCRVLPPNEAKQTAMLMSRAYSILLVKLQQLTMWTIAEKGFGSKSEEVEIDQALVEMQESLSEAQAKNEPEVGEAHMDQSEDGPANMDASEYDPAYMDESEDGPAHKPEPEDGHSQMEELEDGVANMDKPEDGEEYILGLEYGEEYMLELEDDEEFMDGNALLPSTSKLDPRKARYTCCICLKQCYSAAKLFRHQKICDTKLYKYKCACGRMTENAHQMAGHHNTCGLKRV